MLLSTGIKADLILNTEEDKLIVLLIQFSVMELRVWLESVVVEPILVRTTLTTVT